MSRTTSSRTASQHPGHIVVVGGRGGLGAAMVTALAARFPAAHITATWHRSPPPDDTPASDWRPLDLRSGAAIEAFANRVEKVDWLINCAGILHTPTHAPEKTIRQVEADYLLENIGINTLPTLLLARALHDALRRAERPLLATLSARVGSIEDNHLGGWYSYRVSKAALNMAIRTLAIEWQRTHPAGCVVALHPGTNDTSLSQPFQRNVPPGQLFDPANTARQFVDLLERFGPAQSGKFWTWDGRQLPW